ncbi:UNVERIFIED_CONTAM: hypothetical protein FKN15_069570 [Acipenser sinensis]
MMSAAGTGYCFNTKRNRLREKLVLRKHDPKEGSGVYSGGEGPLCRNDSYATLRLQAVLVKAMPSQGRMKQQESS